MIVSAEALQHHIRYSNWASRRLLEACEALTEEERTRDFATADKSFLGTLTHIFRAERIWLARVQGTADAGLWVKPQDTQFETLQTEWPAVMQQWEQWSAALDSSGAESLLDYRDLKGNPWKNRLWHVVLHVVNHSTHHRGQAAGFLRTMGKTPPPLDLIAFVRASEA